METKTIHNGDGPGLLVPASYQLQTGQREPGQYDEIGTLGLETWGGWISEAYNTKLEWPSVEPLYTRIWRSDPEVTIVRAWLAAMAGKLRLEWTLPEERDGRALPEPTDDDKRALELAQSLGSDVEGGLARWIESAVSRVPFYGWGWWETPLGIRREGWSPPGNADWESEYDDNLVGLRAIAFRRYSSFFSWDISDDTGRVEGMEQVDPPNPPVVIPLERSLHITHGDHDNPEGLAMMEALWRLERIKFGYEVTHGIGAEHAAGHAKFKVYRPLDGETKSILKRSARALASASEGNYITELFKPDGSPIFEADLMDVPFSAAEALLSAIEHWHMLKLQLFGMQWVAMATTADTGAYSAMQDASGMSLLMFNALAETVVKQASEQIGRRIFDHPVNRSALPGMTRRPELTANEVRKGFDLGSLSQFAQVLGQLVQLGRDDEIAIRRESGFLPDTPGDEQEDPMEDEQLDPAEGEPEEDTPEDEQPEQEAPEQPADMAQRPLVVSEDEEPIDVTPEALNPEERADAAVRSFRRWAEDNAPDMARLLDARVEDEEDEE